MVVIEIVVGARLGFVVFSFILANSFWFREAITPITGSHRVPDNLGMTTAEYTLEVIGRKGTARIELTYRDHYQSEQHISGSFFVHEQRIPFANTIEPLDPETPHGKR